jgi:hypothetical protein
MPSHYAFSPADHCAKLLVTVTDLTAVQRVLMLLTGRVTPVTRLVAEEAGEGEWRVSLDCLARPDETDLLRRRLCRLPSVLAVVDCAGV